MKVLVLAVLLVSVCCLEGALVKREAEGDAPAAEGEVARYFQSLPDLFSTDFFGEEKIGQLRTQAQTLVKEARDRLMPLADHMSAGVTQLLATLEESFKKATSS